MPKFTDEQVERAKNVDVRTFLEQTEGYTFEGHGRFLKCANAQRTNQPSSLSIDTQMNRIFYNSMTGNRPLSAVDWCMKIKDMDFQSSMRLVLGENPQGERVERPKYQQHTAQPKTAEYEPKNLELSEKSDVNSNVIAYLCQTRKIPSNIVFDCINQNLIYQDVRKNAVFVGYDSEGNTPKYAARRGTFTPDGKEPFKRDCTGSDKNFAFRLEGKNTDTVYVAEAAIDVLSLAALEDKFNGSGAYKEKTYLSTGGAGIDSALEQFCKTHDVKTINVCFDDDEAGKNGMEKIMQRFRERGYTVNDMRASMAHDYNDELVTFNNDPNFYSKPPDVVVNSLKITTERSDIMPEQNISEINQKSTEKALDEIINHYDCLYNRDDLDKLSDNDKKHIADIYYKRPYDENNPDTYDLDKKLNGDILEALNINDLKKIINADKLRQQGVEIEEIKTKSSIREDFYYDPSMNDEDMEFAFDETIRSISFKNEERETVTFNSYFDLKNALLNPDSTLMRSAGQVETEDFIPFDDYYTQLQRQAERKVQPEIKPTFQPQPQRQTERRVQPEIKPTFQPEPQRQTERSVQPEIKPTFQPQPQRQTERRVQPEVKPTTQPQPQRQNDKISDIETSLKTSAALKRVFGNTALGGLVDRSIAKKQAKIQDIREVKIPKHEEKIKAQTEKKAKVTGKLAKVNRKIDRLDKVQDFLSALGSKDKEQRHKGFVTGLENLSDIRRESLENKLHKTENKIDMLSARLSSPEITNMDRLNLSREIRTLKNKSVDISEKIKGLDKLHSDLDDMKNGKFSETEIETAVNKTSDKISERLDSTVSPEDKGIVNHIISQTVESGSEAVSEVSAERAAVQTEKAKPDLDRERIPEEREPEVTADTEQKILTAVAAVTGISAAELNRLPVEVKSDIIAEFRENNGNMPSEQLTERICDIADLNPPKAEEITERFSAAPAEQTKKESPAKQLEEIGNLMKNLEKQTKSQLDKPLFSRSAIMSEKYAPTSSKSAEDIEKDRQNRNRGNAL